MEFGVLQKNLSKRGFQAFVCSNKQAAVELILNEIINNNVSVIGMGNSVSSISLPPTQYLMMGNS
jgi:seryl-tRNA(Sec) selenium transferase